MSTLQHQVSQAVEDSTMREVDTEPNTESGSHATESPSTTMEDTTETEPVAKTHHYNLRKRPSQAVQSQQQVKVRRRQSYKKRNAEAPLIDEPRQRPVRYPPKRRKHVVHYVAGVVVDSVYHRYQ